MTEIPRIGVLLFEDVELLDFAGPLEVFSVAHRIDPRAVAAPVTIADRAPVRTFNGLLVHPDFLWDEAPYPEILLLPGGRGVYRELENPPFLDWISSRGQDADHVMSVCNGALFLAKTKLADGDRLTTHHTDFEKLRTLAGTNTVVEDARVTDNGKIITAAGVSAGIDMSLYFLQKKLGSAFALDVARYLEYDWKPHGLAG
ncbi:DJ-1/PfpI family protein [Acanthopleuribacter pedis]|uniref:DJ-1/PfpI family protein n=1 Tax=Acanthopleuribacter pedis TaxID=442870 RepID=A0A8J7U3J5_9BACT|nr:DJ-1/PfpI family protein [Acanthopleuribacter pedis]MBO1318418.1 DJ-1/PfpI family protein [Acanthopleuribacter pedis]